MDNFLGVLGCGLLVVVPICPLLIAIGWANVLRPTIQSQRLRINLDRLLAALCIFTVAAAGMIWASKRATTESKGFISTFLNIYSWDVWYNPLWFFIGLSATISMLFLPAVAGWRRNAFLGLNLLVLAIWLLVPLWYLFEDPSASADLDRFFPFTPILSLLISAILLPASLRLLSVPPRRRAFVIIGSVIFVVVLNIATWNGLTQLLRGLD
jgi:hypothetical protein